MSSIRSGQGPGVADRSRQHRPGARRPPKPEVSRRHRPCGTHGRARSRLGLHACRWPRRRIAVIDQSSAQAPRRPDRGLFAAPSPALAARRRRSSLLPTRLASSGKWMRASSAPASSRLCGRPVPARQRPSGRSRRETAIRGGLPGCQLKPPGSHFFADSHRLFTIVDVGPRRPAERKQPVPTAHKGGAGATPAGGGAARIEVTSFVSPEVGAADGRQRGGDGRTSRARRRALPVLTPNLKGLPALTRRPTRWWYSARPARPSASATSTARSPNRVERFAPVVALARARPPRCARRSPALGCPTRAR